MTEQLGWQLEFATPADSDDKVACVSLSDDAQIMLSTADERYLPAASRQHRGAGVTVYIGLPQTKDIAAVHERHAAGGVVTGLAFQAAITDIDDAQLQSTHLNLTRYGSAGHPGAQPASWREVFVLSATHRSRAAG